MSESLIYIAAALCPAIVLIVLVYRQDRIEREPLGLLLKIFLLGALTCFPAAFIEELLAGVLELFVAPDALWYGAFEAFLVVALTEELCKLAVMYFCTWKHPAFNYRFDGVVYAVVASLGFAALENILYVLDSGLEVALLRAVLSVPSHACDAVFMGIWYGRAKLLARTGRKKLARRRIWAGYWIAVLLHGAYDACLMVDVDALFLVFLGLVAVTYWRTVRSLRKHSKGDVRIG